MMTLKELWDYIIHKDDEERRAPQAVRDEWEEADEQEETTKSRRHFSWRALLNGSFLTWDFFRQQYILVLLLVLLAFVYIDNRYKSEKEQARISTLQNQLQDRRYESLSISSELMEMSRQSHVIEKLEQYNSPLKESSTPAIEIR